MRYFIILMNVVNSCVIQDCLLLYFIINKIDPSVHFTFLLSFNSSFRNASGASPKDSRSLCADFTTLSKSSDQESLSKRTTPRSEKLSTTSSANFRAFPFPTNSSSRSSTFRCWKVRQTQIYLRLQQ